MERIQTLINRLQEQLRQNTDISQMLGTVQLIQSELNQLQQTSGKILGTSKVAVVLPSSPITAVIPAPVPETEPAPVKEETENVPLKSKPRNNQLDLHFDPMNEIPTFSQHQMNRDVNETVNQELSLNERLKEEKPELMHRLKDSPIKDLRKAIGINDRFVFINELFRGDEIMYERSIKTINGFNIYPEAEYWMNRELRIKLGWDTGSEIVHHFFQLVKRRFSSM